MPDQQRYVVVKGIAGLGNRMLSLLTALLYARLARRRLIVDWRDFTYSEDGHNAFYDYFRCTACDETEEIPDIDSVWPNLWRGHLRDTAGEMCRRQTPEIVDHPELWRWFSADVSRIDYEESILVVWLYYEQIGKLRRHFTHEWEGLRGASTRTILGILLRENLTLHPDLQRRVDEFRKECFHGKTVGVHVRQMDKTSRVPAIHRKLATLLKREPGLQIFLTTDNLQCRQVFSERYANVVSTPKWYPLSGDSMHQNESCPNRTEEGAAALVDMYLLASCDYLILDESSSFSYLASLLTSAPPSNVFNVQRGRMLPPWLRHKLWRFVAQAQWNWTRAKRAMVTP